MGLRHGSVRPEKIGASAEVDSIMKATFSKTPFCHMLFFWAKRSKAAKFCSEFRRCRFWTLASGEKENEKMKNCDGQTRTADLGVMSPTNLTSCSTSHSATHATTIPLSANGDSNSRHRGKSTGTRTCPSLAGQRRQNQNELGHQRFSTKHEQDL